MMPKTRPPYAAVFRQQLVELVRAGRTPGDLAREFEPSAQAIRNWLAQADRDAGERTDGLRTDEGSVPSFVEKEKRRNLLLTKQIAQRGEGGIRREEGYHD